MSFTMAVTGSTSLMELVGIPCTTLYYTALPYYINPGLILLDAGGWRAKVMRLNDASHVLLYISLLLFDVTTFTCHLTSK